MVKRLLIIFILILFVVPCYASGTDFKKAIEIRNEIYSQVQNGNEHFSWTKSSIDEIYRKSMAGEYRHICGGMALLYLYALKQEGIPARYVGLFDSLKNPNTHSTVEIWTEPTGWVASDPTYNFMYKWNGIYLSYGDIAVLEEANRFYEIEYTSNGFKTRFKTGHGSIFNPALYSYIVTYPYMATPLQFYPNSWDGTYKRNGNDNDIKKYPSIYDYLGKITEDNG